MAIDFPESDARGTQLRLLIERAKYERHLAGEVSRLLDREFNRLADIMLSAKYRDLTRFQQQRLQQMLREIGTRLGHGYDDVTQLVLTEMRGYAQLEADVSRRSVGAVLTAGGGELTVSLAYRLPQAYLEGIAKLPIQGLRIGEWFEAQAQTMSRETRRIIQQGLVEGKGTAEIARRIVADARTQGPVLVRRAKNEATIIARTTVNAVQNDAAMTSYAQLPESVSDSYLYVAVLDSRTSIVCAAASGRVFRYDDPKRLVPPLHPNCRSTTLSLIRGAAATVAEQKSAPSLRNYGDWLREQSTTVQNEILGPTRAGLFRDGSMSLSDAVDADNRVLTLKELRVKLGLDAVKL